MIHQGKKVLKNYGKGTVVADPNDAATFTLERDKLVRMKRLEERLEKVEGLVSDLLLRVKGGAS